MHVTLVHLSRSSITETESPHTETAAARHEPLDMSPRGSSLGHRSLGEKPREGKRSGGVPTPNNEQAPGVYGNGFGEGSERK